ncbi:unnamed protein product [Cuscuta epithymum]|uniref:Homing endonuclease LAGLIDADG domain-containing protein n=1 Tax=Cuscuta epithymum TaxID=186058 RepID=A0AAV0D4Q9_9ASTE|nr:unnamed protein product [Cuscuta epithymum]
MLPGILQNAGRIHDNVAEILKHNGGTFEVKGPWGFTNLNLFLTCDPANINHILCRNFKNYPKGPHFQRIFDVLGETKHLETKHARRNIKKCYSKLSLRVKSIKELVSNCEGKEVYL